MLGPNINYQSSKLIMNNIDKYLIRLKSLNEFNISKIKVQFLKKIKENIFVKFRYLISVLIRKFLRLVGISI